MAAFPAAHGDLYLLARGLTKPSTEAVSPKSLEEEGQADPLGVDRCGLARPEGRQQHPVLARVETHRTRGNCRWHAVLLPREQEDSALVCLPCCVALEAPDKED